MRCPECGSENPPEARLCVSCQEILQAHTAWQQASQQPQGQRPRYCGYCGRAIPWSAEVCPFCGHNYMAPPAQHLPSEEPISYGLKIVLYVLSLLNPIVGVILGVVFLITMHSAENKHIGKMCLVLAMVSALTIVLAGVLYVVVMAFGR